MGITEALSKLLVMTAQVVLSALFLAGYFLLMYEFTQGRIQVQETYKDMFTALLGVLTAGVGTILAYWFQRTRQASNP